MDNLAKHVALYNALRLMVEESGISISIDVVRAYEHFINALDSSIVELDAEGKLSADSDSQADLLQGMWCESDLSGGLADSEDDRC